MSTVFTAQRSPLDQGLLAANLALAVLALGVATLAALGAATTGWLQVPVLLALVTWFFATPLLAWFGGRRARTAGRRPVFVIHSVLGSVWAVGMSAALVLRTLSA